MPSGAELQRYWIGKADTPVEAALLQAMFDNHDTTGKTKGQWTELAGYRPSGDISIAFAKFAKLNWTARTAVGVRAAEFWFEE